MLECLASLWRSISLVRVYLQSCCFPSGMVLLCLPHHTFARRWLAMSHMSTMPPTRSLLHTCFPLCSALSGCLLIRVLGGVGWMGGLVLCPIVATIVLVPLVVLAKKASKHGSRTYQALVRIWHRFQQSASLYWPARAASHVNPTPLVHHGSCMTLAG